MFRVVLEEVGSGVKPCDLTTPLYSIVHIPLIILVYSTSAWNFPVGSRYIGNPGGIHVKDKPSPSIQNLG